MVNPFFVNNSEKNYYKLKIIRFLFGQFKKLS